MPEGKSKIKKIIDLTVYAIAMAVVEAAVVVYVRELYYPNGFLISSAADLTIIPLKILKIEMWRETATIVMLAAVGYVAFQKILKKIAAFFWAFAIWDIFYYIFLYLFLGWPPSLETIDVYCFIPWPWIGPVWLPLFISGVFAIFSLWLLLKKPAS